ncbi:hypothetical protein [Desulfonatronovibrio magnus]|uniref:hypothetical protein n=1 Tax=Desulfonatronovibrio magnus TaxID=698827 RepID=UPI0005EAF7C5|nr:hypothetical protein [Desulfonatronovibrio magnus]
MIIDSKIDNSRPDKRENEDYQEFWGSFGSWQEEKTAEELIRDIYETRRSRMKDVHSDPWFHIF